MGCVGFWFWFRIGCRKSLDSIVNNTPYLEILRYLHHSACRDHSHMCKAYTARIQLSTLTYRKTTDTGIMIRSHQKTYTTWRQPAHQIVLNKYNRFCYTALQQDSMTCVSILPENNMKSNETPGTLTCTITCRCHAQPSRWTVKAATASALTWCQVGSLPPSHGQDCESGVLPLGHNFWAGMQYSGSRLEVLV